MTEEGSVELGAQQVHALKQDFQGSKITAKDIFLPPFQDDQTNNRRYDLISLQVNQTEGIVEETKEYSKVPRSVYDGYLSTPNFTKRLCEISDGLIGLEDKKAFLMPALMKVNEHLPAAVYIPFVNQSMRNYAVLHIVAEESRIFKTKERCPLLLCIEVYRPTEISLETIPDVLNKSRIQGENEHGSDHNEIEQNSSHNSFISA